MPQAWICIRSSSSPGCGLAISTTSSCLYSERTSAFIGILRTHEVCLADFMSHVRCLVVEIFDAGQGYDISVIKDLQAGRGAPITMLTALSGRIGTARGNKWLALSFAFAATVINYLDRQTLSVMAPVLLERFQISATSYSHIIFAFMLAYTVMNGVSGPLLDRLGTKVGYALIIAWWSAAEILSAFTAGALSLGIFRFLLGAGEAGHYPAGVKVIGEWFPPQERSLASGLFNSGAAIGAMLAPPLLAWTALELGWQAAFVIVGSLGFVLLAAWWIFYRTPPINP